VEREVADRTITKGMAMAYYKVRIEVWCDWNQAESDLGAKSLSVDADRSLR
jgi:hypothetical protein